MKTKHHKPRRRLTLSYSRPSAPLFLIICLAQASVSCSGPSKDPGLTDLRGVQGDQPGAARRSPDPARPAVLIDDQPLTWGDISPSLAEAAGGVVLEELALDRLVATEYRTRTGKGPENISNERIATERQYLYDSIRRSGDVSGNDAATLAANLRKSRGLGDARFTALLRRTAMMRELIAQNVQITPEIVQQRYEVRFGRKFRVRIITTATETDAAAALQQLQTGSCDLSVRFAMAAASYSTDESKARGGEIEPISPADPAYSPALRTALATLQPGQMTGILALDPGFGIALLEEVVPPAATTLEEQHADIADELRRRQERVLMDTLARRLLESARIVVMDPSLSWSWKNRPAESTP